MDLELDLDYDLAGSQQTGAELSSPLRMTPSSPLVSHADIDAMLEEEGLMADVGTGGVEVGARDMFEIPGVPKAEPSSPGEGEGEGRPSQTPFFQESQQRTFILGTTICIDDISERLREFFYEHRFPDTTEPVYLPLFQQIHDTQICFMDLDCADVLAFNRALYWDLVRFPQEVIALMDMCVTSIYNELFEEEATEELDAISFLPRGSIEIRPFHVVPFSPEHAARIETGMRGLDAAQLNTLVTLRGMVTRCSAVIPDMRQAHYMCSFCRNPTDVPVERGCIKEPPRCGNCNKRQTMKIVHNRSVFSDKQLIKLQETPDSIPEGETPQTVNLCVYDAMVDAVQPGDRVVVTGIFRAQPVQVSRKQRTIRSVFKTYVDVLHFEKTEGTGHEEEISEAAAAAAEAALEQRREALTSSLDPGSEAAHRQNALDKRLLLREEEFRSLAAAGDVYARLVASLAPSIWELDDIKRGILCLLFGGVQKKFQQSAEGRFRGEINVLLVGDPGTSKSQLLQYVHKIAPRGIYTSGKGSSAVGLTAYVTKDPDTKQAVLESGALVLSDKGVCCIDEFDKMSDQTRSILHEAMEQQTVSIAKAGIICSLNARTSILASANPRESRYNPQMSVVENIDLQPTLLSRFDLIYLVLDKPNPVTDQKLAAHLVSLYYEDYGSHAADTLSVELLKDYIMFARRFVHPVITEDAFQKLVNGYVAMRRMGGNGKTITATPRQLESLIRLSEALARMRLSTSVENGDVDEAIRLMKVAMQQAAIDPRTGTLDMDLIQTGRSASSRQRMASLVEEVRRIMNRRKRLRFDELFTMITKQSSASTTLSRKELHEAIQQLVDEGGVSTLGDIRNLRIQVA